MIDRRGGNSWSALLIRFGKKMEAPYSEGQKRHRQTVDKGVNSYHYGNQSSWTATLDGRLAIDSSEGFMSSCLARYLLRAVLTIAIGTSCAWAQIQHASVTLTVQDPQHNSVQGAVAHVENAARSFSLTASTDETGNAKFENVPFGSFAISVSSGGFQTVSRALSVRSNLPQQITIELPVAPTSSMVEVVDTAVMVSPDAASSYLLLGEEAIEKTPRGAATRQMQAVVAETPGIVVQNNGLLNIRGVEDGILYVEAGATKLGSR
jgi:hypothetical protein